MNEWIASFVDRSTARKRRALRWVSDFWVTKFSEGLGNRKSQASTCIRCNFSHERSLLSSCRATATSTWRHRNSREIVLVPAINSWASDNFSGKEMLKFLALKFKNQSINEVKPYEPQVKKGHKLLSSLRCVDTKFICSCSVCTKCHAFQTWLSRYKLFSYPCFCFDSAVFARRVRLRGERRRKWRIEGDKRR